MTTAVFIGDEVTAAAMRLTGMTVVVPKPGEVPRAFEKAIGEAELLIITAERAAELDEALLQSAVRRADPLVLVVPDGGNRNQLPDLDARIERVLGIQP